MPLRSAGLCYLVQLSFEPVISCLLTSERSAFGVVKRLVWSILGLEVDLATRCTISPIASRTLRLLQPHSWHRSNHHIALLAQSKLCGLHQFTNRPDVPRAFPRACRLVASPLHKPRVSDVAYSSSAHHGNVVERTMINTTKARDNRHTLLPPFPPLTSRSPPRSCSARPPSGPSPQTPSSARPARTGSRSAASAASR